MMEDIEHDWVIEQHLHRVTGIETGPTLAAHDVEGLARVTTHGRWVYTDRLKLLGIEPLRFADIPHIRQGQRLSMNSAVSKITQLKRVVPTFTFRMRNTTTGDVIMADIL
jgi:hypothetical protein